MSTTDGGPAFPVNELDQYSGNVCVQHFGVTLRDYFAAKALSEVLSQTGVHARRDLVNAASVAYEIADAMLKAREAC